jgi:hypothetical protein
LRAPWERYEAKPESLSAFLAAVRGRSGFINAKRLTDGTGRNSPRNGNRLPHRYRATALKARTCSGTQDVMTYNKWMAEGWKVKAGEKATKVEMAVARIGLR